MEQAQVRAGPEHSVVVVVRMQDIVESRRGQHSGHYHRKTRVHPVLEKSGVGGGGGGDAQVTVDASCAERNRNREEFHCNVSHIRPGCLSILQKSSLKKNVFQKSSFQKWSSKSPPFKQKKGPPKSSFLLEGLPFFSHTVFQWLIFRFSAISQHTSVLINCQRRSSKCPPQVLIFERHW